VIAGLPILLGVALLVCAWSTGALPRLVRERPRAPVAAPLYKRLALRVALWGSVAALTTPILVMVLDAQVWSMALASASLGAMLGLASGVGILSEERAGKASDELGTSLLGGLLAMAALVALRLQVRCGASLIKELDVAAAWTATLGEAREIFLGRALGGPPEVLTHPAVLAGLGLGLTLALVARSWRLLDTTPKKLAVLVAVTPVVGILIRDLGPCGFTAYALPLGFVCLGVLTAAARLERWRWPHAPDSQEESLAQSEPPSTLQEPEA
jgi:hypothetical protein